MLGWVGRQLTIGNLSATALQFTTDIDGCSGVSSYIFIININVLNYKTSVLTSMAVGSESKYWENSRRDGSKGVSIALRADKGRRPCLMQESEEDTWGRPPKEPHPRKAIQI